MQKIGFISLLFFMFILLQAFCLEEKEIATVTTTAELGKLLFFDKKLSKNNTIACASCHKPEFAFADNVPFSLGIDSNLTTRNTPSAMNVLYRPYFFYDGRTASLAELAIQPIEHPKEMNLAFSEVVERLNADENYRLLFEKLYDSPPDSANIVDAFVQFMGALESNGSAPHDRWIMNDEAILSTSQLRGRTIFLEKGKCFDCHFGPDFTGDEFRNIGLFDGKQFADVGRFALTKDSTDLGRFKVPGLRNIALTAPYMHDGRFATLREVIDFYDNPKTHLPDALNVDTLLLKPLNLSDLEKQDLENFLHSLTDDVLPFLD